MLPLVANAEAVQEAGACAKSKAFRNEEQQLNENEIRHFSIGFIYVGGTLSKAPICALHSQ